MTELYSVPIAGGSATKINGTLIAAEDVWNFKISSDSSYVVYQTDEVPEIYKVPLTGGTVIKLNGTLVSGGEVSDFEISPDSSRVIYRADQDTNEVYELYSSYEETRVGEWRLF